MFNYSTKTAVQPPGKRGRVRKKKKNKHQILTSADHEVDSFYDETMLNGYIKSDVSDNDIEDDHDMKQLEIEQEITKNIKNIDTHQRDTEQDIIANDTTIGTIQDNIDNMDHENKTEQALIDDTTNDNEAEPIMDTTENIDTIHKDKESVVDIVHVDGNGTDTTNALDVSPKSEESSPKQAFIDDTTNNNEETEPDIIDTANDDKEQSTENVIDIVDENTTKANTEERESEHKPKSEPLPKPLAKPIPLSKRNEYNKPLPSPQQSKTSLINNSNEAVSLRLTPAPTASKSPMKFDKHHQTWVIRKTKPPISPKPPTPTFDPKDLAYLSPKQMRTLLKKQENQKQNGKHDC